MTDDELLDLMLGIVLCTGISVLVIVIGLLAASPTGILPIR